MNVNDLAARLRSGDRRALARGVSLVEREGVPAAALLGLLHPFTGRAARVGVTGPPGAGKSSLVDALTRVWRSRGRRVAVIAIDPSSPFTGGALLGDRIRMSAHAADPDVFIRSMATRGALGGLSRTAGDVAAVFDAAGFDIVVLETVGVGQAEVDVVRTADISVVVMVPGLGDDVQAFKAGLMEIADVFVVNKADRDGADHAVSAIEALLAVGAEPGTSWTPPVLRTVAPEERGVPALADAIDTFLATQRPQLEERRRGRADARVRDLLARSLMSWLLTEVVRPDELARVVERVAAGAIDPQAAVAAWLARVRGDRPATGL